MSQIKVFEKGNKPSVTASGADIAKDSIVVLNATTARIGIADNLIPDGETGDVDTEGVFELTKAVAADAFVQGEPIKVTGNTVVKTTGTGSPDVVCANAYVFAASAAAETTVLVKLLG